ncbi:MAG TPA: DUF494 domain-containing protein [Paenalcaligenes sp.]|nr:DUF494 domain-containing protein [Paenalcaligenes sp.]
MFDVLVYLFETYYNPQACPNDEVLAHKLAAVGFDNEEIHDALDWLQGLSESTEAHTFVEEPRSTKSFRIYTAQEQHHFETEALGFIHFLEHSGVLSAHLREILIERAIAVQESPLSLDKLKIIALIILWRHEIEIDHLIFEELISYQEDELPH